MVSPVDAAPIHRLHRPPRRRRWRRWLVGAALRRGGGRDCRRWRCAGKCGIRRCRPATLRNGRRSLRYELQPGPSDGNRYPQAGPYDERLGYTRIPGFIERLTARHHPVAAQARQSPALVDYLRAGLLPAVRREEPGRAAGLRLSRRCAVPQRLSDARLSGRGVDPAADRARARLHRKPRGARLAGVDPQSGGRVGPARPGGDRPAALGGRPRSSGRRRQHAGHPAREIPPFAGRPHRRRAGKVPAARVGDGARLPRRHQHRCRARPASCSTTSTACRSARCAASARSTACSTGCTPGTAPMSTRATGRCA